MKKFILSAGFVALSAAAFAQFSNSVVNPNDIYYNQGLVGIGVAAPASRLDVSMGTQFMYNEESGIRLTYPIPALINNPGAPPIINTSIFEIRQKTFGSSYSTKMVMNVAGNIGIGIPVTDPLLKDERVVITDNYADKIDLHVKGFSLIDGEEASLLLGRTNGAKYGEWGIEYNEHAGGLNFWKPAGSNNFGNYYMFINDKGKVGIGVNPSEMNTSTEYNLYVANGILTERVKAALRSTSDWADYVFKPDYQLMNIMEVDAFIRQHGHLPGVPAAEEVKEQGIDMALMDAKLLEKIEELTLYVIELKKENEAIKAQLNSLKK